MVCMGFEPGPQDARRRWNHGAMAAALGRPRFKYRHFQHQGPWFLSILAFLTVVIIIKFRRRGRKLSILIRVRHLKDFVHI